jgi:uncharacterized repeat protein (TIGR01451 family)
MRRRRFALLGAVIAGTGVLAVAGFAAEIVAETLAADNITAHSAVLHGIGDRAGSYFVYWVDGDTTTGETTTVPVDNTATTHAATITGLAQDTPYDFEFRGHQGHSGPPGYVAGGVLSFKTLVGSADVKVAATGSAAQVTPGGQITYTATVTNAGPDLAIGVYVSDALPAGMTLVSVSASQGTCTTTEPLTCTIGSLAAGAAVTETIVATGPAGFFTDTFQVGEIDQDPGFAQDPDFTNNKAGVDVTFATPASAPPSAPAVTPAKRIKRTVTLSPVRRGKPAHGSVFGAACTSGVPVQLQRHGAHSWVTTAHATTHANGSFALGTIKKGTYRTVAPAVTRSGRTCLRATSVSRTAH